MIHTLLCSCEVHPIKYIPDNELHDVYNTHIIPIKMEEDCSKFISNQI